MVEREVRPEEVLLRERLNLVRGHTVGVNPQAQAPGHGPVLPVRIREGAQRHELIVRREVFLLQSGQIGGPLHIPGPELGRP